MHQRGQPPHRPSGTVERQRKNDDAQDETRDDHGGPRSAGALFRAFAIAMERVRDDTTARDGFLQKAHHQATAGPPSYLSRAGDELLSLPAPRTQPRKRTTTRDEKVASLDPREGG